MRLFLSVPLPDAVKDAVADIQSGLPEARWVAPDSLHLTLRFLGQVDRGTAEDLHHALAAIRAPAFPCRVVGLGTFGTGKRVRALWAGVQDAQPFKDLHHRVEAAVRRAGLAPEERKFKPHVTLARFRPGPVARLGAYLAAHEPFDGGSFTVDAFHLMESHLGHEGAHYESLAEYPLVDFFPDEAAVS